ncbi:MAG: adenine nucleotide alpha hydrolase [Saprospiraceae bacterium]|nr:adenine nucleotide alpha hydrolase [Saprospiraceae bacterium]
MNIHPKAYFSWSSGKDSAIALHHLQQAGLEVSQLITTVNSYFGRVSMHGLRRELLVKQAIETGIPLSIIDMPKEPSMKDYDALMTEALGILEEDGFTHCGFGDIFLEDLKFYREKQLEPFGIKGIFPIWKQDTKVLLQEFIALGFKAIVICLKSDLLDDSFLGREIDDSFIQDLPDGVDPCGENGEFHTFCYDGPIFANPISFTIGEKVFRAYKAPQQADAPPSSMGFWFLDLLP